jgi:hypothetical protein
MRGCFGAAFCCPGDLDRDGYPDIVIGDPDTEVPREGPILHGKVAAYSGKTGAVIWTCTCADPCLGLGFALWPVNDRNGDGVPDVLASWHMFAAGGIKLLSGRDGKTLSQSRSSDGSPMPTLGWRIDGGVLGAPDKAENVLVSQFAFEGRGMPDQAVVVFSRTDLRVKHQFAMPPRDDAGSGVKK